MSAISHVKSHLQTLSPIEGELPSKEKMISQANGHIWRCIDFSDGIYTFTLKDEFNRKKNPDATEKMNRVLTDLYPALEPSPRQILERYNYYYFIKAIFKSGSLGFYYNQVLDLIKMLDEEKYDKEDILKCIQKLICEYGSEELAQEFSSMDPDLDREGFDIVIKKYYRKLKSNLISSFVDSLISQRFKIYSHLGFSAKKQDNEVFFTIPSVVEFQERWETEQFINPKLPEVKIYPSKGIASDLDFVAAFMSHDVTVSFDEELIHDYNHLFDVIRMIFENSLDYQTSKSHIVELAQKVYDKIMFANSRLAQRSEEPIISELSIKKLEASLGLAIDLFSTYREFCPTWVKTEKDFLESMAIIWEDPANLRYFQKRFGDENINFSLPEIMKVIDTIDNAMKAVETRTEPSRDDSVLIPA